MLLCYDVSSDKSPVVRVQSFSGTEVHYVYVYLCMLIIIRLSA